LKTYYMTALLIIAGLSISSHLVLDYVLQQNHGSAYIINISGRQRMLCQRIASLAGQYRLGDMTVRPDLVAALEEFTNTEVKLSNESQKERGRDPETVALKALYAGGPGSMDTMVQHFINDANTVVALPYNAPTAAAPLQDMFALSRKPLLVELNQVVALHQAESERRFERLETLQWGILAIVLITLAIEAIAIFAPMIKRIVRYTEDILQLATLDPLTEILNRRGFLAKAEVEQATATRNNRPLCIAMLDADHFKRVNDTYGHDAGDEVLKVIASTFRTSLRASDTPGRFGGEEFALLLPETTLENAAMLMDRLRANLAAIAIQSNGHTIKITVSIGVTQVRPGPKAIDRALSVADNLMYAAKQAGRNQVVHKMMTDVNS
jgi:diguanylate cyclase (GGDEF)-like protein